VTGLYLIRPDGTGLQPVTENFAGDHSTDYAPEGLQTRL
jgi:hypothetical protein